MLDWLGLDDASGSISGAVDADELEEELAPSGAEALITEAAGTR